MRIKDTPPISIVVPLFNKGNHIFYAISSILNQTVEDYEIIVVDDGSTDNGAEIVRNFNDQRIKVLIQENKGVSYARNSGINKSNSDLIAFLDADDEWRPEFIETILRLSSRYPQAGACATSYHIITPSEEIRHPIVSGKPFPKNWEGIIPNYYQISLIEAPFYSSSIAVRKAVFDFVGGFPKGIKLGEDLDMWLRIAIDYPIAYNNTPLAIYHQEASNRACVTHRYHGDVPLAKSANFAINKGKIPPDKLKDLLELVARQQLYAVQHRLLDGDKTKAREILKKISATQLFRLHWFWWRFLAILPTNIFIRVLDSYHYIKRKIPPRVLKTSKL